jgi:hypothetical protein
MRVLIVLVLIVSGVAGLGFYRGWFHLTSDGSGDKPAVTVTVDKEKIHQDTNDAHKKVQELKPK